MILEGSKSAVRMILEALALEGEVGVFFPWYPGHLGGIKRARCKAVPIKAADVKGWISNLRNMLEAGFKPVAVILSPDNPEWLPRELNDCQTLFKLARQYKFWIISDEAYLTLAFDGKSVSMTQVEGWEERVICLQTGSKPFCIAGWKLANLVARADLIGENEKSKRGPLLELKCDDSEGGSKPAQKAYAVALWCTWYPRRLARKYFRRARFLVDLLHRLLPGIVEVKMPAGGMFVYFRVKGLDSTAFEQKLKALGFEIAPGEGFGQPDHIRWCLNQGRWVTLRAVRAATQILVEEMKTLKVNSYETAPGN